MHLARRGIRSALRRLGYDIVRAPRAQAAALPTTEPARTAGEPPVAIDHRYADFDQEANEFFASVEPYTMTPKERVLTLRTCVQYIVEHEIPGAIVECGVWKGGSMMAAAKTLLEKGTATRELYLFDTFEGMTAPTQVDADLRGDSAADVLSREDRQDSIYWAYSPIEEVRRNLERTRYDMRKVFLMKGPVEETLPASAPEQIALLRLDTDWYESTYHELVHLYPRLAVGGVLIIDDYGHWAGARRAVDQYIEEHRLPLLFNRIDYSCRVAVKTRR